MILAPRLATIVFGMVLLIFPPRAFAEALIDAPMERDGSGTSWLPDATSMRGLSATAAGWTLMDHGSLWLRWDGQDAGRSGSRGRTRFDAPNWFMLMGSRPVGENGRLALRGMVSLDRLTEGGAGYPLLFQTGESWQGRRLVDRQHPHDLFMELSGTLSHRLSGAAAAGQGGRSAAYVYVGYPGEPALGPPAFMHRPSAAHNGDAPLGHHWQDSTHIAFGVATVGLRLDDVKIEGSLFNGREPDENRYDFDPPRFDSYSGRVSVNPDRHLALQLSHGFLKRPEALEPGVDVHRTTASLVHVRALDATASVATTLAWGLNAPSSGPRQNSVLLESELDHGGLAIFSRIEWVQKSAGDLDVPNDPRRLFGVTALSLGAAREVAALGSWRLSANAQATTYGVPRDLRGLYGAHPFSLEVGLQVLPAVMSIPSRSMPGMGGM